MERVLEPVLGQFLRKGRQLDDGSFLTAICCLGAHVPIVLPDSSWIPELIPHLPPESKPDVGTEVTEKAVRFREIFEDSDDVSEEGVQDDRTLNRDAVLRILGSDIEYAVAERSASYVFLHAGVVAVDGQVLVFPGESHAGKSTLVAALVQQGATYYSDEYAVLTREGLVLPYLRQIALRNSIFFPQGRTDLSAHAPAANEREQGNPARRIFFLKYQPESGAWTCDPLDRTTALIELCKNTVGFRERPDMSFAHLNRLLDHATAYAGTRSEADEAARNILELVQPSAK